MTHEINLIWYYRLWAINLTQYFNFFVSTTAPSIFIANGIAITSFSWSMKYSLIGLMANSCPMKVSCHVFMAHEISRDSFSWQFHASWKSFPCFHGPWNVLRHVFMENSWVVKWNGSIFMENSWPWIQPWNLFCSFHGPWNAFRGIFPRFSWHFHTIVVTPLVLTAHIS